MTSVLFVTWDGGGNVPPVIAIAREIAERGEPVRILGHPRQRSAVESAGLRFEPFRTAPAWSSVRPARRVSTDIRYARLFTDRGLGVDVLDALRREPADRVVVDGLLLGVLAELRRAGHAYTVLVHTLRSVMFAKLTRGPLAFVARSRGLDARVLYGAADAELVVTAAALDAASARMPRRVRHVGPVLPVIPSVSRELGEPRVLVSLSTTYVRGQRELLQRIVDALAQLPVRAVVTTGPSIDPAAIAAAQNVEVVGVADHAALMRAASLVIGHGGHATTMLALAHGLPLLVIPTNPSFDQPAIARLVSERGWGRMLRRTATTEQIRSAATDLLATPGYREAASVVGAALRREPGAPRAADILLAPHPRAVE